MNINNGYEQHVEVMKQLKMSDSFYEVREPSKENFEKIYNQAKDENINISSAKDFLNSLSKEELKTLQNHTLLVDSISVDNLSDEGAYNLLLNHYEQYDFDNDGFVSTGIGTRTSFLPSDMPNKEKEILVETLNEMDEKDRFLTIAFLQPLKLHPDTNFKITQDAQMDYESIMKRFDTLINPKPPAYTSPQLISTLGLFKDLFEKNFNDKSDQNEQIQGEKNRNSQLLKARLSIV